MNTLIDLMQQRLQDIENQVALFKRNEIVLDEDQTLTDLVAKLQTDVTTCKNQISNFQSNLNSLNNTYTQIVSTVESNSNSIENLQKNYSAQQELLNSIGTQLSSLDSNYTTLSSQVEQNSSNISNNTTEIQINSDNIKLNSIDININKKNISNLNTQTVNLRKELDKLVINENSPGIDNELFFIVKGTYVANEDINSVVNGTY